MELRQFAGKAMLLASWSLSQVVAIGGTVCAVVWCCGVLWDQQQLQKMGKEKLRRHLLAEAGGQLRTPHTVNKKSILFTFNGEKEEKEDFGGSEAKRFILKKYTPFPKIFVQHFDNRLLAES